MRSVPDRRNPSAYSLVRRLEVQLGLEEVAVLLIRRLALDVAEAAHPDDAVTVVHLAATSKTGRIADT